jgi:hypothetical protein
MNVDLTMALSKQNQSVGGRDPPPWRMAPQCEDGAGSSGATSRGCGATGYVSTTGDRVAQTPPLSSPPPQLAPAPEPLGMESRGLGIPAACSSDPDPWIGRMGLRGAAATVACSISSASGGADGPLAVPWDPSPVIDLTEDEDEG